MDPDYDTIPGTLTTRITLTIDLAGFTRDREAVGRLLDSMAAYVELPELTAPERGQLRRDVDALARVLSLVDSITGYRPDDRAPAAGELH